MNKSLIVIRSVASLLTVLVASTFVFAAIAWSGDVKIRTLGVSDGTVFLNFTTSPFNHNCAARNGTYVIGGSSDNVDKMTSLATQALLNSRNVSVAANGTCSADGYPVLVGLALK